MRYRVRFYFFISFVCMFLFNVRSVQAFDSNEIFMIEKLANTSSPKISNVTVNGSVATIHSYGTVSGYYIGTKDSINDSSTYSVKTSSNSYYVGVKNGTYYFWVYGGSATTGSAGAIKYATAVKVTSSCNNQTLTGVTGTATVERCKISNNGGNFQDDVSTPLVTCASGYSVTGTAIISNDCKGTQVNGQQLVKSYCKVVASVTCSKDSASSGSENDNGGSVGGGSSSSAVSPAALSSLSVNQGSLSPSFSASQKNYNVSVGAGVSSISISATPASGSSFVSGYGARSVNLNYGNNKIQVKVKNSAGSVTVYNILVNRADGRKSNNTLNSITLSSGNLSPKFTSSNTSYTVSVPADVSSINIGADLADSSATFENGYGPRTINLSPGINSALLKVVSENGHTKVYTVMVMREGESNSCASSVDDLALLKSIELESDLENVKIKQLDFDEKTLSYNITVPYEVGNLTVKAYVKDEGDTYKVEGSDNLEVNIEKDVQVIVTSRTCSSVSKVYHIGVTREEEKDLSSNAEIKSMLITNHEEFEFEQNTTSYNLKLNKNESELEIKYETENENTTCQIEGNEDLSYGSVIEISCISEDGENTVSYEININGVNKGTSILLIIFVVILLIVLLAYLILRILGYKIYFNFAMVGAFFRGIGEKIRNIFDR